MDIKPVAEHIDHALNGPPRFSVISICNAAGVALLNAHDWIWTTTRPALLSATSGQEYIDLPAARQILEVQVNDSPTGYRVLVGAREMLALRRGVYAILDGYEVMLSYRAAVGGGAPVRVLEIHPAPSEDKPDLFRIWYRADWTVLDDDDDAIYLPDWLEGVYLEFVRAFALGWHYPEKGDLSARISAIKAGEMFHDATQVDGGLSAPVGILQGTWSSNRESTAPIVKRNING